jgi:hypothetical protein
MDLVKQYLNKLKTPNGVILLAVLPALLIIYLLSVNTPFWDEWELVPIIQHLHSGHFYIHDFLQQHNEHRPFFPNLVLVGFAYITHWNIRVESFLNLLTAIVSFILLKLTINRNPVDIKHKLLLIFVLALIWFSPVQTENWLWGWQLEWFFNILGIMIAIYVLSETVKCKLINNKQVLLLISGCILAQYSLGNGVLIWPLTVAALFLLRVDIKRILVIFVTGIALTILFYFHYTNPHEPSKTLALRQPFHFSEYVLGYLGRPLSFYRNPAIAIGFLLVLIFIFIGVYLYFKQKTMFLAALPWLVLGSYSIGTAIITGFARLGFGVSEALSSRYTTISSLLVISVVVILWQNERLLHKLMGRMYKTTTIVLIGLFCLIITEFAWGIHSSYVQHGKLTIIQSCTRKPDPTSECLALTYPNQTIVSTRLRYLKTIHWAGY